MLFEILQQTAVVVHMMEGCHFNDNKMLLVRNTAILIFFKLLPKYIRTDYVHTCKTLKEINKLDDLPKMYFT